MKKIINAVYSEESDMTFIMEEIRNDNDELCSMEVKGFYFGKPVQESTDFFYGSITAIFEV